jgi:metal-responsive CopG/Arc/MetJ family transcriptional regulator
MKMREHVVSVKLSAPLYSRVARIAKKRQAPKSQVIREAIEAGLDVGTQGEERSFYAVTSTFAGCARGPRDLSTNPRHMKSFGK